jgi:hypothetical protein
MLRVRRECKRWCASSLPEQSRCWGVVNVGVGDNNMTDLFVFKALKNCVDMCWQHRPGIENTDFTTSNDVGAGTRAGEWSRISRYNPANTWSNLDDRAIVEVEIVVKLDVTHFFDGG